MSEPRHPYEFPRFKINNSQREQSELNSPTEHAALTSKSTHRAPNICSGATNLDRSPPQTMNADSEPRNLHSGHTYESFWREHSISNNSRSIQVQDDQFREPSLAPPVDIQPRNRRRPHSLEVQPHLVTTNPKLPREPSADSATSNITISPITPCQSRSSMRTASQNAAMEKDAVETLLFMSSPGNSGHHPATRSLGTPLRGSFAQPASRIGFTESMIGEDSPDRDFTTTKPFRNPKSLFKPMGVVTSADVDRLLDEMPDGDSSSEDEDGRSAPQRARMYLRP